MEEEWSDNPAESHAFATVGWWLEYERLRAKKILENEPPDFEDEKKS